MDPLYAVAFAIVITLAIVAAIYSMNNDKKVAEAIGASNPEPIAASESVTAATVQPVSAAPIAQYVPLRFGQVFWACVLAQVFLGFVVWVLWLLVR